MKYRLIFFLLLWACQYGSSQEQQIDSLIGITGKPDTKEQINAYVLLTALTRNSDPDTALFFAKKAYALAEETASAYSKIVAYNAMGSILHVRGNYDLSLKYYGQALELADAEKNDSLKANALSGIGASLWQRGKHAEALEHHFKSLRIREEMNDLRGIVASNNSIGMVYQTQEKLEIAEKYVSKALGLLKTFTDPALQINTMHTLANIYGMQGKIKEAFAIDQEGLALAEKTNSELAKSLFYDNMGNCYLYGNPPNYTKAIEFFTKTLQIDSAFDNKKQMSDSYVNLGDVFFQQKKYAEAIPYLQRCIVLADESGYVQGKLKALQMLSTAYQQSGKHGEAYASLKKAMRVKDSLVNISSENRIAEMQALYETEKKQQQINLQHEQLSKKNFILAGTIILFVLLALLALSGWLRYRLKQKAKLQHEIIRHQELSTKAVLKAEEDERQRIARDLHDGVGQMMSATKMNLSALESDIRFASKEQQSSFENIINLVDESCKEIRSVSHNMMPNALLKNNLAAALRDFVDKLDKKSLEIHLYTEGLNEKLDSNIETILYRIIQECVNNVIRHAGATTLDISVIKDPAGISATIEDNGKGFDLNDPEKLNGIGLKNIQTRVDYLKGSVEFDAAPGRGTLVALHIPVSLS